MSKQLLIDKDGILRGFIEKHDGTDTPDFDEQYAAIVSKRPGENYVYNVNSGKWVYEEPEVDTDPELTAEEALDIIMGGSV